MMFTNEQIDYLNSLLDDDETSPLVDSILDKLEENTIINMRLKEVKWTTKVLKKHNNYVRI